ncbi:MAG: peroxidase-related enzyme [Candidatus Gracilibacteria bacterium]
MTRITLTNENTNDPITQEIFAEIKSKAGKVPAAYRAFARLPHILQANWNRTKNILGKGNLPIGTKEAIATRVSKENGCDFCLAIHKKNLEKHGFTPEQITEIENGDTKDDKLNHILRFVTTATKDPHKLTDADFAKLKELGYTDEDILEILTVMEMYTGYNKIIVALDLKLDD